MQKFRLTVVDGAAAPVDGDLAPTVNRIYAGQRLGLTVVDGG